MSPPPPPIALRPLPQSQLCPGVFCGGGDGGAVSGGFGAVTRAQMDTDDLLAARKLDDHGFVNHEPAGPKIRRSEGDSEGEGEGEGEGGGGGEGVGLAKIWWKAAVILSIAAGGAVGACFCYSAIGGGWGWWGVVGGGWWLVVGSWRAGGLVGW